MLAVKQADSGKGRLAFCARRPFKLPENQETLCTKNVFMHRGSRKTIHQYFTNIKIMYFKLPKRWPVHKISLVFARREAYDEKNKLQDIVCEERNSNK